MKKYTFSFLSLMLLLLYGVSLSAQCGDTTGSFCYDSNQDTGDIQFTACPDPGETLHLAFTSGVVESGFDDLFVFSGTNQNDTDTQIAGPIDGDLAGLSFNSDNPGDCLTIVVDSDFSVSCQSGLVQAEFFLSCSPIILGCTDSNASNFDATATHDDGSCLFPEDINLDGSVAQNPSCPSSTANLFDSGGGAGPYSNSEDNTLTLCPEDPVNEVISITFDEFLVEGRGAGNCWDQLFIFDGADNTAPIISSGGASTDGFCFESLTDGTADLTGVTLIGDNASGCLTFNFVSDGSVPLDGFAASWSCIARPNCSTPQDVIIVDVTIDQVEIQWTSANDPITDHMWIVEVGLPGFDFGTGAEVATVTVGSPMATIGGLDSDTDFEVIIQELCDGIDGNSIPTAATAFRTLPDFCGDDQFVDDGGDTGNYSDGQSVETIICPNDPTCEKVTVQFTDFQTEATWDGLFIFDADSQAPDALIAGNQVAVGPGGLAIGAFSGGVSPGTITATNDSGCLTFLFSSDGSVSNPGWVADVICALPPALTNDIATITDPCYVDFLQPAIFDPCSCNIPTELQDGLVVTLGNFNEELDLVGVSLGSVWNVTSGAGFDITTNVGVDAVNDANANGILDTGDTVTDSDNDGFIRVTGTHVDGVGFDVELTDGTFTLAMNNLCNQPRPDLNLPPSLCTNGIPIDLESNDALGSTPESVVFNLTGPDNLSGITTLDPTVLTPGMYNMEVLFNGDNPPSADTPESVGCPVEANFSLEVLAAPSALACNLGTIQVSLDDNCSATLLPDNLLEGADGCDPSYEVVIMDALNTPLGNVVDASFIGEEWSVKVIELSTGNECWGTIIVEDKLDPTIVCQPVALPCTANADVSDTSVIELLFEGGAPTGPFPANMNSVFTFDVDVDASILITDLNFIIDINHTSLDDLDILLTSPSGTQLSLWNNTNFFFNGCGNSGIGIILDDEAPDADGSCDQIDQGMLASVSGNFLGFDDVSTLEGEPLAGTWTIEIQNAGGTAGLINQLEIQTPFSTTLAELLSPVASDNCGSVTLDFSDAVSDGDCTGVAGTIIRTWTATDESGNSAQCEQVITFERPDIMDVVIPGDIEISCLDFAANPNIVDATQNGAGVPTIDGMPIVNGDICQISSTQVGDDVLIDDICDGTFKIRRKWLIIDWCTGDEREENQLIKVVDDVAPVLVNGADQLPATILGTIPAGSSNEPHQFCEGNLILPELIWEDACSDVTSFTTSIFDLDGTQLASINTNGGVLENIPLIAIGTFTPIYEAVYTATDDCGNVATHSELFETGDGISPTCVADEITQVAVGYDSDNDGLGDAVVYASTFDDGSHDNCGDVHFLVDRQLFPGEQTPFNPGHFYRPTETFTCNDIGADIQVFFLVIDDFMYNEIEANLDQFGFFNWNQALQEQFEGHYNICMVQTLVEDKLAPFKVEDVDNMSIACDDYFNNISPSLDIASANGETNPQILIDRFGDVSYDDNCEAIVNTSFTYNVNSCGVGTITRNWTVADASGNIGPACSQTISVFHVNDWQISFPADIDLVCLPGQDETLDVDFGEPQVFDDDCELIAISADDVLYDIVPDACYKIIRTYTAINWCQYDGDNLNDDQLRGTRTFEDGGNDSSTLYSDTADANDDGIVVFIQQIKVQDNAAPVITEQDDLEFCIDGLTDGDNDCDRDITLPEATWTDCSEDVTVTYTVAGLGVGRNYSNVAPGTFTVLVTAVDNCGNQSSMEYDFTVRDCKAPTPYCNGGLIIELMPQDTDGDGTPDEGMIGIWAIDFDNGSFDNCTDQDDLEFFIADVTGNTDFASTQAGFDATLAEAVSNLATDPNGDIIPGIIYTCDDISDTNFRSIAMFVRDEAGNVDACISNLQLESAANIANCGPTSTGGATIAGALATTADVALEDASVALNNNMDAATTDSNGEYTLEAEVGSDVTVTPSHDVYDQSVTTIDLVIIRKHILNVELLDSPYKVIAADVNNSGSITAADLVAAKRVILGLDQNYANNTAWVFIDASYTFASDWTLTDGYPSVTSFNNLDGNVSSDFVAVRIGDVNSSFGLAGNVDSRSNSDLLITTQDVVLKTGQEHTVEFTSEDYAALGYQFTLNYSNLEVIAIDGNAADFAVYTDAIATSYHDAPQGDRLFAVTFKATSDVVLSRVLFISDDITKAEAYRNSESSVNVSLNFTDIANSSFVLEQNSPNPFRGETVIRFNLPTASKATITISDLSGKIIRLVEGDFAKGYNNVTVDQLGVTGVLYYKLETATDSAVRKMVVLD